VDELVDYCIDRKYRLRLPFARMPRIDGSWIDGQSSRDRSREIASQQPRADNTPAHPYSEEVRSGDIFGNREQMEDGYVWTNDMRINSIRALDGSAVGVCEFFTRPFFKPPTSERGEDGWIKYESCGSCSTFVFGNLKRLPFRALYNSEMIQQVRGFFYEKYSLPRNQWMFPCRHCLCIDQIYSYASNGEPNVGLRFFPGDDLYRAPGMKKTLLKEMEGKTVVFFGVGAASRRIARYFPLPISYLVDNNPKTWGQTLFGARVENPARLKKEAPANLAVVVASQYYAEISQHLRAMGLEENRHFWDGLACFRLE
jgi:hypothetical protein